MFDNQHPENKIMDQATLFNSIGEGDLKLKAIEKARTQLKMNLSLLEMLKGNTPLEDLAIFREQWVEPLVVLLRELENNPRPGQTDLIHVPTPRKTRPGCS